MCCLALLAVSGSAQTQGPVPSDLAAILGSPATAAGGNCGASDDLRFVAARPRSLEKATCTANCAPDPYVTCSTPNQSDSCTAVDRNCSINQRGYVQCGTTKIDCATPCPPTCTEGSTRFVATGCCDDGGRRRSEQRCTNNQWVYTGEFFCGIPCGPITP